MRSILAILLFFLTLASITFAHESQPGTLEIKQMAVDKYDVTFKAPIYYGKPHPASLQLPKNWQNIVQPTQRRMTDSIVFKHMIKTGKKSIEGDIVHFPGLESTITDVFVRLTRLDGTMMTAIVRPTKTYVELRGKRSWSATAGEYTTLGFHHIMLGIDHLLFVLGLLLIVQSRMMLLKTITSFTLAHSMTLGLATLGFASVPLAPLNAAVALSILFLGPEIVRSWKGETSLTIKYPWIVAFLFGLLHGFGFASGLSTTGMPSAELPWALLFFNVGVELGQLTFVFLVLWLIRSFRILEIPWPRWAQMVPGYAVGSLGAFWTIQRTFMLLRSL
jgi:hydrogenase/urease accessory protein HupE